MHVWVGIIGATMRLGSAGNEELYPVVTAGRYLLTGCISRTRLGTKTSKFGKGGAQGFCVAVSGSEAIFLSICPAFQIYTQCPTTEKRSLTELHCLEEVFIPTYYIFFEHRYLLHEGCA